MKQTDPQYKLRWTSELRDAIDGLAARSGRTINAEICHRLEASLKAPDLDDIRFLIAKFKADTSALELDKSVLQMHLYEVGLALLVAAGGVRHHHERLSDAELDEMIEAGNEALREGQAGFDAAPRNVEMFTSRVDDLLARAKARGLVAAKPDPSKLRRTLPVITENIFDDPVQVPLASAQPGPDVATPKRRSRARVDKSA